MTRLRAVAGLAALVTALLVQATLVSPLALPVPASLPAVLVAAVALCEGPGCGIAFGFATGLIADLGSEHPAGVLALCWLGLGLGCGLAAAPRSTAWRDALVAGLGCGAADLVAALLLAGLHADAAGLAGTLRDTAPATLLDALLALPTVVLVRAFLRSGALRSRGRALVPEEQA